MVSLKEVGYGLNGAFAHKNAAGSWPIGLLFRKTGRMLGGNASLEVEISIAYFSVWN